MDCFKRLCDEVIILCNNCDQKELDLIDEYGFKRVNDRREWGTHQWRIKQDFIERDIKQMANEGDVLVCLDMDEVLSERCTKEWLMEAPLDAYHVFIVDLWNDPQHFKPESCFWNVRIWKWNGETKYKAKPVHCGLAPEWTYHYHRHAPFLLLHKGLMDKESRLRKIKRYEKYDPHHEHLSTIYYDMLKSNTARPFNEDALADQIAEEVATYNQSKPRKSTMKKPVPRFAYVRNQHGQTVDIPEKHLQQTLKRKGFEFIGWADEDQEEIESMFEEDEDMAEQLSESTKGADMPPTHSNSNNEGSYQRPAQDEKEEVDELNTQADKQVQGFNAPVANVADNKPVIETEEKDTKTEDSTLPDTKSEPESKPKKAAAKKAAKKVTKK